MSWNRHLFVLLTVVVFISPTGFATFSFPSFASFARETLSKFHSKLDGVRGQQVESFRFKPKPDEAKGQQVTDINFGPKPNDHVGQEVEEINFGSKPENHQGQEIEDINFGSRPKQEHRGQEMEEIQFGEKPDDHRGQELEDIHIGSKPKDHREPEVPKPKEEDGQKVEDFHFKPEPEEHRGQEVEDIHFGAKGEDQIGQEIEEINFGSKPEDHKGQEIEEINFGGKPGEHKGQEVEEINFKPKPEDDRGQQVEEINFGSKPNDHKGQEIEEISFGSKPKDHEGQEIEDFHLKPKPEDDRGQQAEEINFGPKPDDQKGQEVEEIEFGSKHEDHKGQEVEEINFGRKPDDQKGQKVEEIHFKPKLEDHKGQEVEDIHFGSKPEHKEQEVKDINFGSKPNDHKGQEIEDFHFKPKPEDDRGQEVEETNFGGKSDDHKGQKVEEINFKPNPEEPKGQQLEDFHFGSKPADHEGQQIEEINFGSKPEDHKGQEVEEINFGRKPDKQKGQKVEEINFESKPNDHKGQEIEDFHFGSKPEDHKGQEIEEINFGPKPKEPKSQQVEEFHFGSKPADHKGQEIEEINFGSKPEDHEGQEVEEINLGGKPDDQKGQKVEEIKFEPKPEDPKGQQLEDFHFGSKPADHKGQEIEEINFGSKPEDHEGQEVEEINLGGKPDDQKGQKVEEIKFEPKPEDPKGQQLEAFHFGSKPTDHKGQEIEEINFGSKEEGQKGQEIEDFHFGSKPEDHKRQEVEEINFGEKPGHQKGQEVEEINFGPKPKEPKGQQLEDFHFGSKPADHKGQEIEEINFGSKPEDDKGQEVEEINFGLKPGDHKGQEIEDIEFGSKPTDHHGQKIEDFHFKPNPEDHNGQEIEEISFGGNPKPHQGQEIEDMSFGSKPKDHNGQEVEEIHFGSKPEVDKGSNSELPENWFDIFLPSIPETDGEYTSSGCTSKPQPPENSILSCDSKTKCTATCHNQYTFTGNEVKLTFECINQEWVMSGHQGHDQPKCEAVCMPPCLNGGKCSSPNQCDCPEGMEGPQCQFGERPCLDHPPVSQNSQIHCNLSNCLIECFHGYSFPDGSTVAKLFCHRGQWTLVRDDWDSLPHCKPTCYPPCLNGGTCLDFNKCQCPREYAGPQCQYEIAACDGHKLNFNGHYTCRGEGDKVSCTLSCPEGHDTDVPIAREYTCDYSSGKFQPEPIPRCLYGQNVEVIKFVSNSNKIHGGGTTFDSSKLAPEPVGFNPNPRECNTWKGSHYKTFDGKVFSFDSDCSFTLAQDVAENTFRLITEKSKCETRYCSSRRLRLFYQEREFLLSYENGRPVLLVDDHPRSIPLQFLGFSVERKRDHVVVSLHSIDVTLTWDNEDHVSIHVNSNMWNRTGGLCGNFNSDPNDDCESDFRSFLQKWRNENVEDIFNCNSNPVIENSCQGDSPPSDYCRRIFDDGHFEQCRDMAGFGSYKDACLWDLCQCGQSCACATVREFVRTCKSYLVSKGIPDSTSDWRQMTDCPFVCPLGKVYSSCGPSIEPSCSSIQPVDLISYSECVEGCFCPPGFVTHNDSCINREHCPCQWKGIDYKNGGKILKGCNTCTCQDGEWSCTNLNCGSRCGLTGGIHYHTFDGRRYDFAGHCSYYLLKSDNYTIELESSSCSPDFSDSSEVVTGYSSDPCSRSLIIRHGSDQVKLKRHREIFVNGEDINSLPVYHNGIMVRSASSVYVIVSLPDETEIWWNGNANFYIDLAGRRETSTGGLCGTFNGNPNDDFLTPEGDVEHSSTAFAEKWKVEESCREIPEPTTGIHPCDSNVKNKAVAEKYCQKLKGSIFGDCHRYVEVEGFYKNCLHQVCSCRKELKSCFCPSFADYANECTRQGVEIPWRNEIRECGLHCPLGQTYQPCGNSCTRSCQDISLTSTKCKSKCAEGCNCPEGSTLNSLGRCIPIADCPCLHQNSNYKAGHELIMDGSSGPQFCICQNARWSCTPATKLEIDRVYENSDLKCDEGKHEEYTTCEPAEPKTCKNMHEKPKHTTRICFPGCVCKKGFVWDSIGKTCVNASECPCHHGGRSFADGEKIQQDCNVCTCQNGLWTCSDRECPGTCTTWGDSHFKTFDGRIFDFQGSCDFVLAAGSLSEYDNFVINLQIVPCGSTGISCPKSVTLRVGSHGKEEEIVFSVSNPSGTRPGLERILTREAGVFVFAEVIDLGLTLQWDKGTRVYVKLDSKWRNRVKGLCGNFNGNDLDDFKTPSSGETSEVSAVLFADSWRLQSYCPQSYHIADTCAHRPHRKPWAVEKCSILKSDVFEPCHSEVPYEPYLERCIVDTCGCDKGGDCECMCTAIAAYAHECTAKGVPIKWRTQHLCGLQCDAGLEYSPCVSPCPPKSCDRHQHHPALVQTCSEESCVEGCEKPHCPPGHVLSHSESDECVPITSCKTVCLTVNNTTYLEGDLMESDQCHSCFCSHHSKTCTGRPCPEATESPAVVFPDPTTSRCLPGQVWDDCIISCSHICHSFEFKVRMYGQCFDKNGCISGCRPANMSCSSGMFLRDENTCVRRKDCSCLSHTNATVKPGDVVQESDCERCQCINNEYDCVSVCSTATTPTPFVPHPTFNYSQKVHRVTPHTEYGQEGNVTLIYLTTTPKPPSPTCLSGEFESLIDDFARFTASSQLNDLSSPLHARMTSSKGAWSAGTDDSDQYLQVDLGRVEPIYAVNVAGASGKYVTGYHLLYSTNGHTFSDIFNEDGKREIFGGPFDGHSSVKQTLSTIIEARYIRFHPFSWQNGISMKVDLLGCKEHVTTTTTATRPTTCDKPIGIGQKYFPKLQITVTSSKPNTGPGYIGFDNERGWQPLTNSKSEWVQLDFGDYVNFTGIVTKGVPQSNDLSSAMVKESWVERYKVMYSHDGLSWNPILDDFGKEMLFMGNTDCDTGKQNFFARPIRAKMLKVLPIKWHNNIAMRLDVTACYEPAPMEVEATPSITIPESPCNICNGVFDHGGPCPCKGEDMWDGEKCVPHTECPCVAGLIAYPVGTTFTTQECEECICRLYGIPHCTPKICDDCPHGLQKILTPLCGCLCKPCEGNTRLCPTSNICLEESAWCNGVQDCPDDELNCTTPAPIVVATPKTCKPSCPHGYEVVYRNTTAGPTEPDDLPQYQTVKTKSVKTKKSVKTYIKSKKWKKNVRHVKTSECPPYDCIPVEEETTAGCPAAECPLDYSVVHKETIKSSGSSCPLYTCEPVPEFANCTVSSRSVKTFDGTHYKYDICDHVITRHDSGSWNMTMVKTCSFTSSCTSSLLIHHGDHVIELHPHNRTIKFDSFTCSDSQVELLNTKITDFVINRIGNSVIFTSNLHEFDVVFETNGNVKVTVPGTMKHHLNGLCGLYNGHPEDDKTKSDGKLSKTTVEFGDSWTNPGGAECVERVCPIEMQNTALDICLILRRKPFTSCEKESNLETCIESGCNCLMSNATLDECRCSLLADFAAKCKSPDLFGWRVDQDCPSSCPPNLVHYDCYPYACEPTCGNDCTEPATDCYSGCFCPDGLVKKGDQCIKVPDCRDCVCSGLGDSTYLTFDGGLTFNGNCTYVATRDQTPGGSPSFEVLITNGLCNGSDFMTCTERIGIKASGHSLLLTSLPNSPKRIRIEIDGIEFQPDSGDLQGTPFRLVLDEVTSSVTVELPKEHVHVRYAYTRFAFTISLPSHYYSDRVEGLCGTCSEEPRELENPESWQVDKDENCMIEPPPDCVPTPAHKDICLLMSDVQVFGQCVAFVDPTPFIDQCLSLLCHNGHVCNILEAYSQECREAGVCVDWRSEGFCPFTCPSDLEYRACESGCSKTCDNYDEDIYCSKPSVEGCFCLHDEVLINGTCQSVKYCDYCDEQGRHYDSETWQQDKCTNCTCKDRVITCNRLECPEVDLECQQDEIVVIESNDHDCCPKHKCGCRPRDECPHVEVSNDLLPVGMVAIINETGCCPREEIICRPETCPPAQICKPHYVRKVINATDCCQEIVCEKPTNLCLYESDDTSTEKEHSRKKRHWTGEAVKEIGERWTDGPCKVCVCIDNGGHAEAVCTITECPPLEDHPDFGEYELHHVHHPEKCCPDVVRKNCKHNGHVYKVGEFWMPDDRNPCETIRCSSGWNGGQLLKERRMQVCDEECEHGWKYQPLEGKCCGHCVQMGCIEGDKIHSEGATWLSPDGCVNSTCTKTDGQFFISTATESCPSLEDCPQEDIYKDKCCLKCKLRAESKKICAPQVVSPDTTVNLFRERKGRHGQCRNLHPIHNFTECVGNCDSFTVYKPETWTHENVCKCCQPEEYSLLMIPLQCEDGYEVLKSVTVPSKCSCMSCHG